MQALRLCARLSRRVVLAALVLQVSPGFCASDAPTGAAPRAGRLMFNPHILAFPVDVEMFAEGDAVAPGTYRVDVLLNQEWKARLDVRFAQVQPEERVARPCFEQALLDTLGLDGAQARPEATRRLQAGEAICGDIGQVFEGASAAFDFNALELEISAPQALLRRTGYGKVDPKRWDAGITAATLAYDYNGWTSKFADTTTHTSHSLGLSGGVNLGDWRLRYRAWLDRSTGAPLQYHSDTLTVSRALPGWRSHLTIGDATTDSRVLDGVDLRGIFLQSDERMEPDAMHSFAPVIRGIAQSNARVTVHQRGTLIFEMTVPPGPFMIDTLYPNGNGGDLIVTVTEADGTSHRFTVPYARLPDLLRPGVTRYSVAVGEYRNRYASVHPKLATAALAHGVNNTVTLYGGWILAQGYRAVSAGAALNLSAGAVAVGVRHTSTSTAGQHSRGVAWRASYAKAVVQTETDITLTAERVVRRGYANPAQALDWIQQVRNGGSLRGWDNRRSQLSLNLNQILPHRLGALTVSAHVQDYWEQRQRDVQYHVGYGRGVGSASASISVARSRNLLTGHWDNQILLNVSFPLETARSGRPNGSVNSSYAVRRGSQTAQTSVSAAVGDADPWHYNLYAAAHRTSSVRVDGGASMAWSTRFAQMGVSVSAGAGGAQQAGWSASGGLVAFQDGIVLSPELGDTVGIVQARNAAGARTDTGARLDARGHAIAPYLQPYRENIIKLDTKRLPVDVELRNAEHTTVPTAGAVVLLRFDTRTGYSTLITGRRGDGSFLPFAAGVFDEAGSNIGYLGQGGQALLRLANPRGVLQVRWGSASDQQCRFAYDLENSSNAMSGAGQAAAFRQLDLVCL